MTRIRKDVDAMWEGMDEGLRATYGKEFVDEHIKCAEGGIPQACKDTQPVIDAMTDALFALSPKTRYLIPGGAGWYDHHVVSRPCIVAENYVATKNSVFRMKMLIYF